VGSRVGFMVDPDRAPTFLSIQPNILFCYSHSPFFQRHARTVRPRKMHARPDCAAQSCLLKLGPTSFCVTFLSIFERLVASTSLDDSYPFQLLLSCHMSRMHQLMQRLGLPLIEKKNCHVTCLLRQGKYIGAPGRELPSSQQVDIF
jgi:hypothetical protein